MLRAVPVLAAAALLQAPPQLPTIRARADLVQVDAVVVDADGRHVRGLTAADFVLRDRGKPQVIASFDEIAHVRAGAGASVASLRAPRDVGSNQIPSADRLVVMVVDDLHIYKDRTERTREIARRVLDELGRSASMAVLFTSGDRSTRVTDDAAVLRAAVDSLKGRQSWRRPHPGIDQQTGGRIDPEMSSSQQLAIVSRTQETSVQQFFDNLAQYKLLQDAARLLRTNDARRKAFVLISEGIGKELSGLFQANAPPGVPPDGGGQAFVAGSLQGLTTLPPNPYHDDALIDMMESLRRANVATYAIDPRGKVESKDLARECFPAPRAGSDPCSEGFTAWESPVRQAQRGLGIMAEASGGFAITDTDDFTSGLDRILGDLDHYYMLGFYPSDPAGKGYRPLDVRVNGHPDWTIRYRRGYMGDPGRGVRETNATEMVSLSSGILPRGDLPLKLNAIVLPGSRSSSRVALVLEVAVPRADVEERDGRVRDTLKYELLVVDEKKAKVRTLGGREGRLTLSPADLGRTPPDVVQYQVSETVELAAGQYEVRWSATSAKLGRGGSVYLPIVVPSFREAPVLGGIAMGYAEGPRVPVAPVAERLAQRGARVVTPAVERRPDLPFAATLDREFTAADTLRVHAEGSVRAGTHPMASVEVVNADGRVVRSPSPSFTVGETVKIMGDVPLDRLPAGTYVLRVALTEETRTAVREIAFTVR